MIMTSTDKFIYQVKQGFQNNKGRGSVYCFTKEIIPRLVLEVVQGIRAKNPNRSIFIVVDDYATRISITTRLQIDNIKVLTKTYINTNYIYSYDLIILVGINDSIELINHLYKNSKFTLSILTKNIMNPEFITQVRSILPNIETTVSHGAVKSDLVYSPVEETRIGVTLNDSDLSLYKKCTDYINECVTVFGDLKNIEKCKVGDPLLNISASEFRYTLAKENGWSEDLNTNIDFHRQIDEIYNPNTLFEKACTFYTIAKQRRDLCSDNVEKLREIARICYENKDKKILIISKRGEFAAQVTKYINSVATEEDSPICGDYHDCIEDAVATDKEGNIILVKSGVNKGKPRIVKAQAISTSNLADFNSGCINVLSIKNSSNNKLKIACDLVILTTPYCNSIIDIKSRFTEITFNGTPTRVYKLYCSNTIEHNQLMKEKESPIIKVINYNEENFVEYDEKNGDIIL